MFSKIISLAVLAIVAVGCRSGHKVEDAAVGSETKAVAHNADASYVADVKFDKGSAALSEEARAELDRVIASAAGAGKIDEIKILSWADAEYPADAQKALPKPQRDLASKRNKAMNEYIKSKTSGVNVDTFNMAESPSTLGKLFNTSDARLKKSLETAGMGNNPLDLRSNAHASKSTVMLIMDNE